MISIPNYWEIPYDHLAAAWREASVADYSLEGDPDGEKIEILNFIEDAILQRIGAPEDASGDDPKWQEKIREWGTTR